MDSATFTFIHTFHFTTSVLNLQLYYNPLQSVVVCSRVVEVGQDCTCADTILHDEWIYHITFQYFTALSRFLFVKGGKFQSAIFEIAPVNQEEEWKSGRNHALPVVRT